MEFEIAYELDIQPGNEVVFVRRDDRHRKVRVLITEAHGEGGRITFSGHSLGSSFKEIKAAKKDEPPVPVRGRFEEREGHWVGSLESAA